MTKTNFSDLVSSSNSNPFETLAARQNPFAQAPEADAARGPVGYALVSSGPAVDPSEIENAAQSSVEVNIGWGTSMLHVAHLAPPRSFVVGDGEGCDYQLPESKLGSASAPLVVVEQGQTFAVLLPSARGWVELPGKGRMTLDEARSSSMARPCSQVAGAVMVALPAAARVRQEVGDLVLSVGSVAAGKKVRRVLFGAASVTGLMFAGLSLLGHASLLGGLAFFKPALSGVDDDADRREREVIMMQMLKASAEKEQAQVEEQAAASDAGGSSGESAAARGPSGAMGSTTSLKTGGKFAVKGRADNADPHLSREQARDEASHFGMIGLLQASVGGDTHAPSAFWGRDSAEGRDALSAMGNLWGATLDESAGVHGLGLHGVGEGGDGQHESVGISKVGTLFSGNGTCKGERCDGVGNGHGPLKGDHKVSTPSVRISTPSVSGRIAPELIQRIVRQSFGRLRMCYENGLRSNPNLAGRVSVRFVIDRSGRVASASNGGSDLPDSAVISCVVSSFAGMSFPEPENGIVSVTYPIAFAPGS